MDSELIEVASGVVTTPDGQSHQVLGGAYLPPGEFLRTNAELERLRQRDAEAAASNALPLMVIGAGLIGLAAGYWLGRESTED
jgi:hypothetical protein